MKSTTSLVKCASKFLWLSLLLSQRAFGREVLNTQNEPNHRSLAGFVLPFQFTWRFVIADVEGVPEDRVPTEAEYEGIREATVDWFTIEIPFFYADEENFSFREIDCENDAVSYNPEAEFPEFVHEVRLDCEVVWDADALEDTPGITQFLPDMNAQYLLDNFVDPHLRTANPQNPRNIFQFSSRVGYVTNEHPEETAGPLPATEGTTPPVATPVTPAPTPAVVTPAPTPATTTIAPAPSPTSGPAPMPTLPQKKEAPPAKCGSLATSNGRGGAAAESKGCLPRSPISDLRIGGRRKLKGGRY